jgi:KaiC/GvpD/RAD55 family RecA-like ATPase
MKSTLMLNLLYNNCKQRGLGGIYISLEEKKESLMTTASVIGFSDYHDEKLAISDLGDFRIMYPDVDIQQNWMDTVQIMIKNFKEERGSEIVVIDSLSALYSMITFKNPRKELFYLFRTLQKLGITTFLITEITPESEDYGSYNEGFLSDGIIQLKYHDVGETESQLRIKCVKMRHVRHSHGFFSLLFDEGEFMVTKALYE